MNPFFGIRVSFKREIRIVMGTLGVLLALPVLAVVSVTDVAALKDPAVTLYAGPVSIANTYDFGYCTFWAALRREQTGHSLPSNWGNANTWGVNARAQGYLVDHIPTTGAVMQTTAGPLGHVAYVEAVSPFDGSWTISEMNFKAWDVSDTRTLTAIDARDYSFIH